MTTQAIRLDEGALAPPAGNPARFGGRWRLVSAGLSNVWRYGNLVMPAPSGRLLLRGPNGTGKTTALEALWPFLLDLDKTKLRAGHSRTTTLTSLMREGRDENKRIGYAWLTFAGPGEEGLHSYGTRLVFSNGSTPTVKCEPFTIPGEPIVDMPLTGPGRTAITTADAFRELVETVGGTVFKDEDEYLTSLGNHIFSAAREDLINIASRVRRVRNPNLLAATSADQAAQALREALPGVSSDVIEATGEALAATDETRAAFQRDVEAAEILVAFAEVWAGHAADVAGRVAMAAADARGAWITARREAERCEAQHRAAVQGSEQAAADVKANEDDLSKAQAEIDAIERSPAYATIARLADLRAKADAKENEAAAKVDNLKRQTRTLHRDGAQLIEEAHQLADAVAATCQTASGSDPQAGTTGPVIGVTTRPQATLTVGDAAFDPGPALEIGADPDDLGAAVAAWNSAAKLHENRANDARLMLRQHRLVLDAERDAEQKAKEADSADQAADRAAQDRDRKTDVAVQAAARLGVAITEWAAKNPDLTTTPESDPLDADAVSATVADGPAALLAVASDWKETARHVALTAAADLKQAATGYDRRAATIRDEAGEARQRAEELRAGRIIPPPRPDWAGPAGDDVFANALQWADNVDDTTRALVESALASAGVLGGTLSSDGVHGTSWAVTAATPPVASNLSSLVEADPRHPLASTAHEVLQRITVTSTADAVSTDDAATVGTDGTFRFGVIVGRAPGVDNRADLPTPSHIGAAQRRAAALVEAARLDAEADRLTDEATTLELTANELRAKAQLAVDRAESFPSWKALDAAEADRVHAARWATELRGTANAADAAAAESRRHAREVADDWRSKVIAMGLPTEPDALDVTAEAASDTARTLRSTAMSLAGHRSTLLTLRTRAAGHADDRGALAGLHAAAKTAHATARQERSAYDLLQAEHGKDAADLSERLSAAKTSADDARELVSTARILHNDAVIGAAKAESAAQHAAEAVADAEPTANAALAQLRGLIAVPDVTESILGDNVPLDGDALISQIAAAVETRIKWSKKKVADTYEAARAVLAGIWAIDRADGYTDMLDTYHCTYDGGVLTPAAAAALARKQADNATERLHTAEETALRDFIVGRLPAAIGTAWHEQHDWVDAVNRKMESASASSGVGVRVRTTLRDDLTVTQRTIYRLACRKSAATRTSEEDQQLAEALKSQLADADGETVTDKVRQAVDVRDWVRVDYLVHRPGQEPKRWTRQTGLSGGERRLVILAPMLAAIAAIYDNLPDTSLRLAALDEVPAEVDEQGREGLARYIAELDLDVICTSYLWDGAPGAWDGVDAHDLEAIDGIVVAFPMLIRGIDPLPGDPDDAS